MLFDMGPFELLAIVVLAVMLFGPDKLPKLIQDVAAFLRKVREFSDSAKQDIRKELGPEFQDFEFEDLKPKNFVRKHVLNGEGADEFGLGELKSLKDDLGLDEIKESLSLDKKDFDLRSVTADDPDPEPEPAKPAVASAEGSSADDGKVSFDKPSDDSAVTPDSAGSEISFDKPGDAAAEKSPETSPGKSPETSPGKSPETSPGKSPETSAKEPQPAGATAGGDRPPFDLDAT